MDIDFGSLIVDLETLSCSSKEDFANDYYNGYETYVNQYNDALENLQTLGFFKKQKFIEHVPFSEQTFSGSGFTKQEKAKLREVTNASSSLLQKVKLLLAPPKTLNPKQSQVRSNQVFVVHGNDNEMKQEVVQTLQKLELDPIVLHEANQTQTIIKKIEDNPQVSFAVVLVSPDNLTYIKEETPNEAKPVANQNIIFELGYLLGKLGKQNVTAIYRKAKDFKIPNDYSGVFWIEYKNGWYFELIKELKANNFDVDANKLGWL